MCLIDRYFNVCQATAKIIEEDWREINYSTFTKASYFLNIAIESIKIGEIADFIFTDLDNVVLECVEGISKEEERLYMQDLAGFKQLKESSRYKIVETSFATKSRIGYLLNQKNDICKRLI